MKTLDLEILVMKHFDIRRNIIVPNVSWGLFLHECDVLVLSQSNYATEIEIKVSKADLLKDAEKRHGHFHQKIRRLYFAVPEKLQDIALEVIPERAGLLVPTTQVFERYTYEKGRYNIESTFLKEVRAAKINQDAQAFSDRDRTQLARLGAMRILGLKEKLQKLMVKPSAVNTHSTVVQSLK